LAADFERQMRRAVASHGRAGQVSNPAVLLTSLLRYSFFVNSDLKKCRRLIRDIIKREVTTRSDPHRDFVAEVFGLLLSTEAKLF
jgi:hypothetical protein